MRASKPDELWHVDASAVRLVDGTKIWLHAVIDNYSRRILAWRVVEGVKHQWLFLHRLESTTAVRRLVEFYVPEYNETIPHSAFSGQTPDEVYFGRDDGVAANLEVANESARQRRLEANRAAWCNRCEDSRVPAVSEWALA
ncbi:MAG: hypothetical protein ACI8TX_000362 [Hyphomicrobiaceae bacterium]